MFIKHWRQGIKPNRAVCVGLVTVLLGLLVTLSMVQAAPAKLLRIHFLDVGQADCILIQAPGNQNMLVDAGNRDDAPRIAAYLTAHGVKQLQVIIGTHPHEDHIGGMAAIVSKFGAGQLFLPKVAANTGTFTDLLAAIKAKGLKVTTARAGTVIKWRTPVKAQFLAPNSDKYKDLNNYSGVVKLTYGQRVFLLAGDAERVSEKEILQHGCNLKADLLKVGHHGSASSTSQAFITAVAPQYAVISVGKNNDYKHPNPRTIKRLQKMGIQIYRTDLAGTVLVTSDGTNLKITKTRSK